MEPKLLICQNCGAHQDYDPDRMIIFCPYCGSKELVVESDAVKIERIRNATIREKQQLDHDRDIRMMHQAEMEQKFAFSAGKARVIACLSCFLIGFGLILFVMVNQDFLETSVTLANLGLTLFPIGLGLLAIGIEILGSFFGGSGRGTRIAEGLLCIIGGLSYFVIGVVLAPSASLAWTLIIFVIPIVLLIFGYYLIKNK